MKQISAYTLVLLTAASLIYFLKPETGQYSDTLRDHPFNISQHRGVDLMDIPKKDRPDLAWEQDYLQTMNPELLRPTPEKLDVTREIIKSYFTQKKSSRTGTPDYPWVERGPTNVGGRTRAIMWDPNDPNGEKFWAGGVTGGLWYTDDIYNTGEPWTNVDDFWANISITSIAYDPTNTQVFYVGTGEGWGAGSSRGAGIWKSTDGGDTWNQLSASTNFYYVNDLIVRNESGSGVLYVGVKANYYQGQWQGIDQDGLFRSTNGGDSFTQVMDLTSNKPYAIADIELDADNNIWIGTQSNPYGNGGGQIWSSANGTDWSLSTQRSGGRVELATAPSNADVIYGLIESGGQIGEVIKSSDGGTTWSSLTEPNDADGGIPASDFSRGQAWYDLIAIVDPNDENSVFVGGIDLFRSQDGGSTWDQVSHWYGGFGFPYVHADQHSMAFKPGSSSDAVFGNDGGIFLSTSADASDMGFTSRNNNYNVTQFYAAAIHPTAATDYFLAGSQDNGTQKFTLPGLGSTTEPTGGDGAYCFIDQNDPSIQITSYVYNSYYLSTNGGTTFNGFSSDQSSGRFINPADYDDNQGVLFSAGSSVAIARWLNVKNGSPSRDDLSVSMDDQASHLRVSPHTTNSTTLFVGTGAGSLYRITNANTSNATITEISGSNFPDGNISCLEIGASENDLICTFSNYGVTSIWSSTNGGDTWTSKEGDLPDMPVRWALYNPNNSDEVILATELGIWRTSDFSSVNPTWEPSNEGLANVRVDMLQIRASDNEVIAATYGRGLFSTSGFSSETSGLNANFSLSASEITIDGSIDFTDLSTGSPVAWSWTFEGGTPSTSNEQNPTVTYADLGTYDVSLTVTDGDGNSDTKTSTDIVVVSSETDLPNIIPYQPVDWSDVITITNVTDEFTSDDIISTDDVVYIAYGLANTGESSISAPFRASILIDGLEKGTYNWAFSTSQPFNVNTYSYNYNINIGSLEEGEHVVSIVLDADNTIQETSEDDNLVEKTFYVQSSCSGETTLTDGSGTINDGSGPADYLNDLNCTWIIEPAAAESITLTFTEFRLENIYDSLFIYDETDELVKGLTGTNLPSVLTVNSSLVKLVFVSDESESESGWTLNYTSVVKVPDFVLSELEIAQNGTDLDYSFDVTNEGNLEVAQESSVAVYISDDDQISLDDHEFSMITIPAIGAGANQSFSESISLDGISSGDYYLILVADSDNEIAEEFEDNNMILSQFNVIKSPDLVISNISASVDQSDIDLSLTVLNQGIESVQESFDVRVYLSEDDGISTDDLLITTFTISSLDIDASENLVELIDKSPIDVGEYTLIAVVDQEDEIVEEDENNNSSSTPLSITLILQTENEPVATIFPNPIKNHLTIQLSESNKGSYKLMNMTGQNLQQGEITGVSLLIDMQDYPAGVYLLTVDDGINNQLIKLKKE